MKRTTMMAAALALCATAGTAATVNTKVDLELVLVTDVSDSISTADYNLIRAGYAAAFRNTAVIDKIMDGALGRIAVHVIQFKDTAKTVFGGAWTIIDSVATSNAFADQLAAMTRISGGGGTAVLDAMELATASFAPNNIDGTRQVIDFVIDGEENQACANQSQQCQPLKDGRDAAVAAGVDGINALLIEDGTLFGDKDPAPNNKYVFASQYAKEHLLTGPGAFSNLITDADQFAGAIEAKLIREIAPPAPVPLPAAGWLLVAGLGGLAALARRRKAAA